MTKRVCVIGGGISGLCVAHALRRAGIDVVLFEKNRSVGGYIKTEIRDGFLIEHGPNSTLASRELLDLITDLEISDQIAQVHPDAKTRYILRDGRLVPLPSRLIGLIRNRALTARARLRLLTEPFIRTQAPDDESVAAFFERRFGKEIVDYAVDPFVSGIYAGDPRKLSIKHAFPRLLELEKKFGSVSTGAVFSRKNNASKLPKGTPRSITFKNGMQTLTDKLYETLKEHITLGASVVTITKDSHGFRIGTDYGKESFDAVVISTPAGSAARMLEDLGPGLAEKLRDIYYAPIAVVFTAFGTEQVEFDPRGFGFLVPGIERRKILGSLWTSSVFENRVPEDKEYHLFTTFIGGSRNAERVADADDRLLECALDELDSILGIEGGPKFSAVKKWEKAIPQYSIGYGDVVRTIEEFESKNPGVFFCSNFYKGISVGDCVKNAAATSKRVLELLNS